MKKHLFIAFGIFITSGTFPAVAEWSIDPMENNVVCEEEERQILPIMTDDGAGGSIIAWADERSGSWRIYASRLGPDGEHLWSPEAIPVAETYYSQQNPRIVSDGAGGAIVAWEDIRPQEDKVYTQRVGPDGSRLWGTSGVLVVSTWISCQEPEMVSDTFGGAIITWELSDGSADWIYAQRFNPSGDKLWNSDGVLVCNETGTRTYLCIAQVGGGGAVIAWRDVRDAEHHIYAQYVSSAGVCTWAADGIRPVTTAGSQNDVRIMTLGSTVVLAIEHNNGYDQPYILCQRLSMGGSRVWGYGARVSYGSTYAQDNVHLCAGRDGGVLVTWLENLGGYGNIRAQYLSSDGNLHWTMWGAEVSAEVWGDYPLIFDDGVGGCIVTWGDVRQGDLGIYAQRVDGLGQTRWAPEGIQVSRPTVYGFDPAAITDNDGGVVLAWSDSREGENLNIYAQRVDPTGYLGMPVPTMTSVVDFPNDQGGEVLVYWDACHLDAWPWTAVECYSVWARDAGGALPAALNAMEVAELCRRLSISSAHLAKMGREGWTYVREVPSMLAPEYSCTAFTFGDSTGAGIPMAEYMVIAHSGDPGIFWEADPMTGYSVDNLAPGAPLDLGGESAGNGDVALTWNASGYHDEDLSHYAVYRGEEAGFPLDAAHFIDTVFEETYVDPAGAGLWYYRVTAIDVHGNEGAGSNEVEVLVTSSDTPPGHMPATLALHARGPNPCRGCASLAFELPAQDDVDLFICTIDGRRVATLAHGSHPAGCHAVTWSARAEAQGIYFAILCAGNEIRRERLVIAR